MSSASCWSRRRDNARVRLVLTSSAFIKVPGQHVNSPLLCFQSAAKLVMISPFYILELLLSWLIKLFCLSKLLSFVSLFFSCDYNCLPWGVFIFVTLFYLVLKFCFVYEQEIIVIGLKKTKLEETLSPLQPIRAGLLFSSAAQHARDNE